VVSQPLFKIRKLPVSVELNAAPGGNCRCYGYGWTVEVGFNPDNEFECWTCQAKRAKEDADPTRKVEINSALDNLGELAVTRRCK